MKKINILATFLALAFFASNCKEKCIEIPPLGQGVTSARKVLIEEFTGVRCPNCPQGSAEIANLLAIYKENLIPVSIHAGVFTEPLPETRQDFRTDEGTALEPYLGTPLGYPSAVVDRTAFSGSAGLQSFKSQWAGFIQQDLAVAPPLAINLATNFNATTRQLELDMTILPSKTLSGEHRFSIMLTEDHIIDAQINGAVHLDDYDHEHVLRDMLTKYDGAEISENLTAGVPISRHFSFTVPTNWKAENCHVVAFVHHGGVPDKAVLQAEQVPFF